MDNTVTESSRALVLKDGQIGLRATIQTDVYMMMLSFTAVGVD